MNNVILVLSASLVLGCSAGGELGRKNTETEYGFGFQGRIGHDISYKGVSFFGVGSYRRFSFDGGHDNLISLGVQGRGKFGVDPSGPWWLGGEVAYIHDTSVYDEGSFITENPSSNGFSVGALGGRSLKAGNLDVNVFAGVSIIHFGDFKSGDLVLDESGNSLHLRVGAEVELPFGR